MNGKKYVSVWAKKIHFIKAIVCDSTELLQEVKKWFKYEFTKKIYIKTPTGDACMEIRMDATILELKYLLQERLGFSVSTHNILLQGKILPDSIIVPSILPDSSVIPPFMHTDFLKLKPKVPKSKQKQIEVPYIVTIPERTFSSNEVKTFITESNLDLESYFQHVPASDLPMINFIGLGEYFNEHFSIRTEALFRYHYSMLSKKLFQNEFHMNTCPVCQTYSSTELTLNLLQQNDIPFPDYFILDNELTGPALLFLQEFHIQGLMEESEHKQFIEGINNLILMHEESCKATRTSAENVWNVSPVPKKTPKILVNLQPEISSSSFKVAQKIISPQELKRFGPEFVVKEARNLELKRAYCNMAQNVTGNMLDETEKLTKSHPNLGLVASILKAGFQQDDTAFILTSVPEKSNISLLSSLPSKQFFAMNLKFDQNFSDFALDPHEQRRFELDLRINLAELIKVPMEDIAVMEFVSGSVAANIVAGIDFLAPFWNDLKKILDQQPNNTFNQFIPANLKGVNADPTDLELIDIVVKYLLHHLKQKYGSMLLSVSADVKTINRVLQLSPSNFDPKGDIKFPNPHGEKQERGGFPYYQPKLGWERFGLSVTGIYPGGEVWLSMNPSRQSGSWAVAFHGTHSTGDYTAVKNIISTRTLLKGNANAYGGKQATNRPDPIPKVGIYLTLDIETSYRQTVKTSSGNYELAFQCRVHPDHLWETGNGSQWIVVDSPIYIRPYGIVVRKK